MKIIFSCAIFVLLIYNYGQDVRARDSGAPVPADILSLKLSKPEDLDKFWAYVNKNKRDWVAVLAEIEEPVRRRIYSQALAPRTKEQDDKYFHYLKTTRPNMQTIIRQQHDAEVGQHSFFDGVYIISQVKSLWLAIFGETEEARKVQEHFLEQAPIISQVYTLVLASRGRVEEARAVARSFQKNTIKPFVYGLPVIGFGIGALLKADGLHEEGNEAMKASVKSTAAVVGTVTGGLGGAVTGYVGADVLLTGISSAHEKKFTPEGVVGYIANFKNATKGEHFDQIAGLGLVALTAKSSKSVEASEPRSISSTSPSSLKLGSRTSLGSLDELVVSYHEEGDIKVNAPPVGRGSDSLSASSNSLEKTNNAALPDQYKQPPVKNADIGDIKMYGVSAEKSDSWPELGSTYKTTIGANGQGRVWSTGDLVESSHKLEENVIDDRNQLVSDSKNIASSESRGTGNRLSVIPLQHMATIMESEAKRLNTISKLIKEDTRVNVVKTAVRSGEVGTFLETHCKLSPEQIKGVSYLDFHLIREGLFARYPRPYNMAVFTTKKVLDFDHMLRIPLEPKNTMSIDAILVAYKKRLPEMSFEIFYRERTFDDYLSNEIAKKDQVTTFPIAIRYSQEKINLLRQMQPGNDPVPDGRVVLAKVWLDKNKVLQKVYVDYQYPPTSENRFAGDFDHGDIKNIQNWYAFKPIKPQMLADNLLNHLQDLGFMLVDENRAVLADDMDIGVHHLRYT